MTYTKSNTAACGEMPRSTFGPAGAGGETPGIADDFDDLLAASSFNTPGNPGAPEDAHALLDQMRRQSNLEKTAPEGDIDDALVHLVDRASREDDDIAQVQVFCECKEQEVRPLQRPTWVYPLAPDNPDNYAVDRAGSEVILLRHLSARTSQRVVWFLEYSDPWSAQAVVADLLETDVFTTVRPEVARLLVTLVFDRQPSSPAIVMACEQAITATGLFNDPDLTLLTGKKGGEPIDPCSSNPANSLPVRTTTSAPRSPTCQALELRPVTHLTLYRALRNRSHSLIPDARDSGEKEHDEVSICPSGSGALELEGSSHANGSYTFDRLTNPRSAVRRSSREKQPCSTLRVGNRGHGRQRMALLWFLLSQVFALWRPWPAPARFLRSSGARVISDSSRTVVLGVSQIVAAILATLAAASALVAVIAR